MITTNVKLRVIQTLANYRSGSLAIFVHLISIFFFGLGLSSPSSLVREYSSFILFYAGFISIINSLDLGYSVVISKGEALYSRGVLYLLIFSFFISSIALGILDVIFELRIHYSLLFLYILLGFWLNIVRSLFDRLKWFVLGTIFGNHFLLFVTIVPSFIYQPKSFSAWWKINIIIATIFLLISIFILYQSNRIQIIRDSKLDNSWNKIKTNWKMSLVYFQGNLNGRADRFLYPILFTIELPTSFLFINEAAHRLLFLTSSLIRFNIPEYGNGKKLISSLSFSIKTRIIVTSILINLLIIFGTSFLVGQSIDERNMFVVGVLYAIAASLVVLSQYEFFRLIIKTSYDVILYSQLFGLLVYMLLILLSQGSLTIVALGYFCKCIVEYILLSRGANRIGVNIDNL